MSEYRLFSGTLTPIDIDVESGDNLIIDGIRHRTTRNLIIDGIGYSINAIERDSCDGWYNATANNDGTISFDVKYYNGSCDLLEAITVAVENIPEQTSGNMEISDELMHRLYNFNTQSLYTQSADIKDGIEKNVQCTLSPELIGDLNENHGLDAVDEIMYMIGTELRFEIMKTIITNGSKIANDTTTYQDLMELRNIKLPCTGTIFASPKVCTMLVKLYPDMQILKDHLDIDVHLCSTEIYGMYKNVVVYRDVFAQQEYLLHFEENTDENGKNLPFTEVDFRFGRQLDNGTLRGCAVIPKDMGLDKLSPSVHIFKDDPSINKTNVSELLDKIQGYLDMDDIGLTPDDKQSMKAIVMEIKQLH